MADDNISNGIAVDPDQVDYNEKPSEHMKKMEELEREKRELVNENAEAKEILSIEIERLKGEEAKLKEKVKELEDEVGQSQEAKKASEAIAARAVELETEVSRLQHDLVSAMNEAEESTAEVDRLTKVLVENEKKTQNLEREVELLKQAKAESEAKVKELEKKIGGLEEQGKKISLEEEMEEKVHEKEKFIYALTKRIDYLEDLVAKKGAEPGLINRTLNGNKGSTIGEAKGLNGLKSLWPLLAAGSTGAAVASLAIFVFMGKRR